jgi:hypothetical protein
VLHHHDLWIVDSLLMAVETRQFDCGLVRLGARVAEENPVHLCVFAQQVRQFVLPGDGIQVRRV